MLHLCYTCYTYVTPVLHMCYTCVTPVLHLCYTYVTFVLHLCYTCVKPVLHLCYTCDTPVSGCVHCTLYTVQYTFVKVNPCQREFFGLATMNIIHCNCFHSTITDLVLIESISRHFVSYVQGYKQLQCPCLPHWILTLSKTWFRW